MEETVRFQHFEVLKKEDGSLFELGRGAMGITYKAFDTNLRCHVALKVINGAYLNSEVARQRFLREARAAAALRHPNVATVFHLGSEDDNYFYAMEFVDGETVEAYMKREGAVPAPMALEIASQVSRALGAAHRQGLVHRDIKPSNLMFVHEDGGDDFTVKVIDFGLAKSATAGEDVATLTAGGFLGTPHFASPEQLEEREIDVRSDIYSLGVTLWFMLAGKTPFSGSLAQVMSQHLHREPPFESLEGQSPAVVALLKHMMQKDAADRPQTPSELRAEIEACLTGLGSAKAAPKGVSSDLFETTVIGPEPPAMDGVELASGVLLAERFRLLDEVTASDHGRMFRAQGVEDNAVVAVLILHSGALATSEAFTRLEEEVEKLQRLKHPAFQRILSLEHANHHTFLVLEWVEGTALLDVLRTRRALPPGEAKVLLTPLAGAFDELGGAGLSCPDIAVHEILLAGGNPAAPKFLPLTTTGSRTLAPEATMVASSFSMMKASGAFAGNPANAYVFAVGSLAYEMLGGVRGGSSTGGYVPIPGLSEAGNAALRKALNPGQGFASASAFVAELDDAGPAVPAAVAPIAPLLSKTLNPPPVPVPEKSKRPVLPWILAGAAVLLLAGGLGIWAALVFLRPEKAQPLVAAAETPAPTPVPQATATATPVPAATPDQRKDAYREVLALAEELQKQDNIAAALSTYAGAATKFPEEKEPQAALETLTAGLRARSASLTAGELSALRLPLEQAATLNVKSAQMLLGETLLQSDSSDALKWFLAAANQDQTEAMIMAGQMLASGKGVPAPDLEGAAHWFSKAAEKGDPAGKYLLAECLFYGKGVQKDPKKAIELLVAAAELNEVRSMNMLGDLYRKGVPGFLNVDPAESFRLFTKARELGSWDACGYLGVLYMLGEGVEKADETKAAELFREGAEKGNPLCMAFYAQCLLGGQGTAKDPAAAKDWYVRAARGGNRGAVEWCKKNNIPLANPL
ncbi:MAG: protein kinase domain-containing protein [Terrimicrobiaceae bacterium]